MSSFIELGLETLLNFEVPRPMEMSPVLAEKADILSHFDIPRSDAAPVEGERFDLPTAELDDRIFDVETQLVGHDPEEAARALDELYQLSDDQRAVAVGNLSDEAFAALVSDVPAERRELMSELVSATDDPRRKLNLWRASEVAGLMREQADLEVTDPITARERASAIDGIAEIDDEVERALTGLDEGTVTDEDVRALIERKELERAIEKRHAINLTNDRSEDNRAEWSSEELKAIAKTLDSLPPEAAAQNLALREIHCAKDSGRSDQRSGEWDDGVIRFFDGASQPHRLEGVTSELSGFDDEAISSIPEVLAHELGHSVDNTAAAEKFKDVAGWRKWTEEKDALWRLKQYLRFDVRPQVLEGGDDVWNLEPGRVEWSERPVIPYPGARAPGTEDGLFRQSWGYAAKNDKEYFAECYAKATLAPEQLYEDLIISPERSRNYFASHHPRGAAEAVAQGEQVARWEERQEALRAQWESLRSDVFGLTDEHVAQGAADLAGQASALGLDPEVANRLVAEYQAKAAKAMTPEQLERLTERYRQKLGGET